MARKGGAVPPRAAWTDVEPDAEWQWVRLTGHQAARLPAGTVLAFLPPAGRVQWFARVDTVRACPRSTPNMLRRADVAAIVSALSVETGWRTGRDPNRGKGAP